MSRFAALLYGLSLIGCAQMSISEFRGLEHIETRDDAHLVQFFRTYNGEAKNCPDCVIIERLRGPARAAYFVEPVPTCELVPADVREIIGRQHENIYGVRAVLFPSGLKQVERCMTRTPDSELLPAEYFVVVQGHVLDTFRFGDHLLNENVLHLVGPESLHVVVHALDSSGPPQKEL